jgi:hypothetical protein
VIDNEGRSSRLLELVDLVVEGLEADPQFLGGGRLVAGVLLEDDAEIPSRASPHPGF